MGRTKDEADEAKERYAVRRLPLGPLQGEVLLAALKNVRLIAKRLGRRWVSLVSLEDRIGAGHLALVEAQRRFDPTRGKFADYVTHRVLGAMLDLIRKEAAYRHYIAPYSRMCDVLTGIVDPADPSRDTDETIIANLHAFSDEVVAASLLDAALSLWRATGEWVAVERIAFTEVYAALADGRATLADDDRELLRLHYDEELGLDDIAATRGWTYRKVRWRHQQALVKLASALRAKGIGSSRGDAVEAKAEAPEGKDAGRSSAGFVGNVRSLWRRGHG